MQRTAGIRSLVPGSDPSRRSFRGAALLGTLKNPIICETAKLGVLENDVQQRDRQTDRQTNRQADRQKNKPTDTHCDTHTQTATHTHALSVLQSCTCQIKGSRIQGYWLQCPLRGSSSQQAWPQPSVSFACSCTCTRF